mmetsp:Transcript_2805/g.8481  ORF Transcript_2805/g.8481 Transcript_2805/m.8481 type:complete len:379 (-) Transcript_2805:27-1163(-)
MLRASPTPGTNGSTAPAACASPDPNPARTAPAALTTTSPPPSARSANAPSACRATSAALSRAPSVARPSSAATARPVPSKATAVMCTPTPAASLASSGTALAAWLARPEPVATRDVLSAVRATKGTVAWRYRLPAATPTALASPPDRAAPGRVSSAALAACSTATFSSPSRNSPSSERSAVVLAASSLARRSSSCSCVAHASLTGGRPRAALSTSPRTCGSGSGAVIPSRKRAMLTPRSRKVSLRNRCSSRSNGSTTASQVAAAWPSAPAATRVLIAEQAASTSLLVSDNASAVPARAALKGSVTCVSIARSDAVATSGVRDEERPIDPSRFALFEGSAWASGCERRPAAACRWPTTTKKAKNTAECVVRKRMEAKSR